MWLSMGFECLPMHSPTMPMQPLRATIKKQFVGDFAVRPIAREFMGVCLARISARNLHHRWRGHALIMQAPGKKHHKPGYASRYRMPMHANSLRYKAQAARYAPHSPTIPQSTTSLEAITSTLSQAKPSALARCNKDITSTISDMLKGLPQRLKAMPNYAQDIYGLRLITPSNPPGLDNSSHQRHQ